MACKFALVCFFDQTWVNYADQNFFIWMVKHEVDPREAARKKMFTFFTAETINGPINDRTSPIPESWRLLIR